MSEPTTPLTTQLSHTQLNRTQLSRTQHSSTQLFSTQRRRVMQGIALSAAALSAPGIAKAVCDSGKHYSTQQLTPINSDNVAIELIESKVSLTSGSLARVTVTNKSERAIKLRHLSPGAVTTPQGVYQLNASLSDNPIAVRPGGSYQFWVKPDDGTQALRSQKPQQALHQNRATLDVKIVAENSTGNRSRIQRVQAVL